MPWRKRHEQSASERQGAPTAFILPASRGRPHPKSLKRLLMTMHDVAVRRNAGNRESLLVCAGCGHWHSRRTGERGSLLKSGFISNSIPESSPAKI